MVFNGNSTKPNLKTARSEAYVQLSMQDAINEVCIGTCESFMEGLYEHLLYERG